MYHVVFVLGIQQPDPVIHTHISILFRILFHVGYYRVLSRAP